MAVEERQEERADMRAVHVGIGHEYYLVVAELRYVELVGDRGAERDHERSYLLVREHFVYAGFLHVQYLSLQRKDGLRAPVAALLRAASGRIPLDDVELGFFGLPARAVGELPWEREPLQGPLPKHGVLRGLRGLARLCVEEVFLHDGACVRTIALQ